MLIKSTLREIKTSLARYLAIFAIVALGVGFFSGLKVCKSAMVQTASKYLSSANMYDYEIMSSYGIDDKSVETARNYEGVTGAEGTIQVDAIAGIEGIEENIKWISIPKTINKPTLTGGRMPRNSHECVVDEQCISSDSCKIGSKIIIADNNKKSVKEEFRSKEYTVVGYVNSPLYLDYQRGTTSIGNGSLDGYVYVDEDAFDLDYYTGLYMTLDVTGQDFSDKLSNQLSAREKSMKKLAKTITAERRETAVREAREKLADGKAEYEDGLAEYNSEKTAAEAKLSQAKQKLSSSKKTIKSRRTQINKNLAKTKDQLANLEASLGQTDEAMAQMEAAGATDTEEYAALETTRSKLVAGIGQCKSAISKMKSGLATINKNESKISDGEKTLRSKRSEALKELATAKSKLDDAKAELNDAERQIDELETGNSYVISKEDNVGYDSFESNSDIVNNIAKVFPVFFFLVAALVCMTTMTRMIDEHRTQIGILKALGYSGTAILGKYMFYSGSASLLGAIAGFFIGCKVFPTVIWKAYTMMYTFSDTIAFVFDDKLLMLSLIVAIICSVGATWVSVSGDWRTSPAELIRPRTPPMGRRILLERIPALWNRISFLYKVSIRNLFRYKKRFFMMILGISGCTALLIAGFGIRTSVSKVADYQYTEISKYDYQLIFDDDMTASKQADFIEEANKKTDGKLGDIIFVHQTSGTIEKGKTSTSMTCIASDASDFTEYFSLHNDDKRISFPGDGEVVICKKLRKELNADVGDTVTLTEGYRNMKLKVSGVCDNYVGEYAVVSIATYEKGMGVSCERKAAYVNAPKSLSDSKLRNAAARASECDGVMASSVSIDSMDAVAKIMKSLNSVVYVVILCAALLAFIVLYNLTNINIMERIREIATIKVLGFTPGEVSRYVFRENLFLSAMGAILGIPLGKWLLNFVMNQIQVSKIFFEARLNTSDYIYSVVLTMVFAFIVNISMRRKLDNVSMTESLKSIE